MRTEAVLAAERDLVTFMADFSSVMEVAQDQTTPLAERIAVLSAAVVCYGWFEDCLSLLSSLRRLSNARSRLARLSASLGARRLHRGLAADIGTSTLSYDMRLNEYNLAPTAETDTLFFGWVIPARNLTARFVDAVAESFNEIVT